jgi:rSAM/selenodomain-associated transferase 2
MTVSVIIPVLHESALINDAIAHIRSLEPGAPVEVIVVDGAREADTLHAIRDSEVKNVLSARGRGTQMNRGAEAARGDILLFLHVDTELPRDGLRAIRAVMEGGRFVGGAFDLGIDGRGIMFRLIERVASLRSRLTRIPYGDQAIFLRRDYFLRLGGYREMALMEDVDLMRRVKKGGGAIFILPERVRTSGRRWRGEGLVRCTLRNWIVAILYLFGVSPERLARWYPS